MRAAFLLYFTPLCNFFHEKPNFFYLPRKFESGIFLEPSAVRLGMFFEMPESEMAIPAQC
jgi:hypothetical protein